MRRFLRTALLEGEEGHALPGVGMLIAAAGAIVLAVGAANGNDATTITGGIVLAVGILAFGLADHMNVEYNIFGRLEKLEGTKKE